MSEKARARKLQEVTGDSYQTCVQRLREAGGLAEQNALIDRQVQAKAVAVAEKMSPALVAHFMECRACRETLRHWYNDGRNNEEARAGICPDGKILVEAERHRRTFT